MRLEKKFHATPGKVNGRIADFFIGFHWGWLVFLTILELAVAGLDLARFTILFISCVMTHILSKYLK